MDRRQLLRWGTTLGALTAAGAGAAYRLLPPRPSRNLAPVDELARRLYAGLSPELREEICVPYDHPLRQYHNRGVAGGGLGVFAGGLDRAQRALVSDLLYAGLSPAGRERVPEQFFLDWPGVHALRLLICGDPTSGPFQLILSGPHLNLRLGGRSREGVAFGGPQVYGDQRGNDVAGLPGNVYRYQFLLARDLYRSLDEGRRREALQAEAPIQTRIEVQGRKGVFPGTPVAGLESAARERVGALIDAILSTYPEADAGYARECLRANGGTEALFLSYYEHGQDGPVHDCQVFRLEGPSAVFYFRGHPHVHAFLNVAMDGDAPLSVGELLGVNPARLEGPALGALLEQVLAAQPGADLGDYDPGAVVGCLRAGPVRSGDVYVMESWQDRIRLLTVRGTNLGERLVRRLAERGSRVEAGREYVVATTAPAPDLGPVESSREGILLRDAAVAYLKAHGFSRAG